MSDWSLVCGPSVSGGPSEQSTTRQHIVDGAIAELVHRATRVIKNSLQGRALTRTSFPGDDADETLKATLKGRAHP